MANKSLYRVGFVEVLTGPLIVTLPTDLIKQVEKARMSDGSFHWAFFQEHRKWRLTGTALLIADLDQLIRLVGYDEILRWQNLDERADIYEVVITDFSYDAIDPISTIKYYKASLTLEEAI
jgi:hypothetical protein